MSFVIYGFIGGSAALGGIYGYYKRIKFLRSIEQIASDVETESELALNHLIKHPQSKAIDTITEEEDEEEELPIKQNVQAMDELPTCVQNYLQHCVRDNRHFRLFTIKEEVQLRFKQPDGPWVRCPATFRTSPLTPAFIFNGSAQMNRAMWVEGYECLTSGKGRMRWQGWGAIQVASNQGVLTDKAARVRWLLEAISYPQALLPSSFLRWEPLENDGTQARAVLTHQGITVSAIFTFNTSRNNVVAVRSDDYARNLDDGTIVQCTLVGRCWGHMQFGLSPQRGQLPLSIFRDGSKRLVSEGIVIPSQYEAAYIDENGEERPYVKVLIRHIEAKE